MEWIESPRPQSRPILGCSSPTIFTLILIPLLPPSRALSLHQTPRDLLPTAQSYPWKKLFVAPSLLLSVLKSLDSLGSGFLRYRHRYRRHERPCCPGRRFPSRTAPERRAAPGQSRLYRRRPRTLRSSKSRHLLQTSSFPFFPSPIFSSIRQGEECRARDWQAPGDAMLFSAPRASSALSAEFASADLALGSRPTLPHHAGNSAARFSIPAGEVTRPASTPRNSSEMLPESGFALSPPTSSAVLPPFLSRSFRSPCHPASRHVGPPFRCQDFCRSCPVPPGSPGDF